MWPKIGFRCGQTTPEVPNIHITHYDQADNTTCNPSRLRQRPLGCIKHPTFSKMFCFDPTNKIYLLHVLKHSTMPIFKRIRVHLGGPHPPLNLRNYINIVINDVYPKVVLSWYLSSIYMLYYKFIQALSYSNPKMEILHFGTF